MRLIRLVTFQTIIPWILLILVVLAVIFRRIGKLEIPAWTAFLIAAIILVFTQPNGFENAVLVIADQADVFVFLFGMFVIVTALDMSGILQKGAKFLMNRAKNGRNLLLWIHLGFGLSAAILINDTVAIFAPLILIYFAKQIQCESKPFVIAVAIALTFGSALFPTGNPQNFIFAQASGMPFLIFGAWTLGPTILALLGSFLLIRLFYRKEFCSTPYIEVPSFYEKHEYESLSIPALVALGLMLIGIIITSFFEISMAIVILAVVGVFLFIRNERGEILARLDWGILLFFGGMFVVINSVTSSDIFNNWIISPLLSHAKIDYATFTVFVIILFFASQLFSNVPVAIIVSYILPGTVLDTPLFWVTAALTTTFAGATSVLGAASNIIVLETTKKRGIDISWFEFTRVGFPISIVSLIGVFILGLSYIRIVY